MEEKQNNTIPRTGVKLTAWIMLLVILNMIISVFTLYKTLNIEKLISDSGASLSTENVDAPATQEEDITESVTAEECSPTNQENSIDVSSEVNEGEFVSKHLLNVVGASTTEDGEVQICVAIENKSIDSSEQNLDRITYYATDFDIDLGGREATIATIKDVGTGKEFTEETIQPGGKLNLVIALDSERSEPEKMITLYWSPGGNVYGTGETTINF